MPEPQPSTDSPAAARPLPSADLLAAAQEAEQHVALDGWEQPVRLFALVTTASLVAAEPHLADALADAGALTAVEQEVPANAELTTYLGHLAWPAGVEGCAVAVERLRSAPGASATEAVRLLVAATRGGERVTLVRLAEHDSDEAVAVAHDVATDLEEAVAATLEG